MISATSVDGIRYGTCRQPPRCVRVNPESRNSARTTTGGRWPPKATSCWIDSGGIDSRASPFDVVQRRTFNTSLSTAIR